MKESRLIVLGLVLVAALISGGWLLQRSSERSKSVYEKARLFDDIVAHIAEYAVDSVGEAELYEMAIDGLVGELNDPYASYLRPEDVAELTERTTGDYGGLGMQIDVRDGWITVIAPIAETPAEAAGIESGDRIVGVEGESTYGWRNEQAVRELRGAPGTDVSISIARPGVPEPFDLTLTRASVHVRAVQAALLLDERVAYVSLAFSTMGNTVVEEVRHAVDSLRGDGAQSLIFDLRDAPGGLLNEGVTLTDLFLDEDQVIVLTNGRNPAVRGAYAARTPEAWPGFPVIVLVNGGTASAAEIIAGALQDHDRGVVVGTPTFGRQYFRWDPTGHFSSQQVAGKRPVDVRFNAQFAELETGCALSAESKRSGKIGWVIRRSSIRARSSTQMPGEPLSAVVGYDPTSPFGWTP